MKILFSRYFAIISIFLLQHQFCNGYDFLCSGSWMYSHDDKNVIIYPENYDDIKRVLPVYYFNNDKVGNFLHELTDSLATLNSRFPFWTIYKDVINTGHGKDLYTGCMLLRPAFLSRTLLEKCCGIIISAQGKFGVLFDDSPQWICRLHLLKSDSTLAICSGKSYKSNLSIIQMTNSKDIWCLFKIDSDNKIVYFQLYDVITPIYTDQRYLNHFKWLTKYIADYESSQPADYLIKFALPETNLEQLYYNSNNIPIIGYP